MRRRPWWVWCCVGVALIIAVFGWSSPDAFLDPLRTPLAGFAMVVVLAAGVVAVGSPGQRANGRLMLLIGVLLPTELLYHRNEGFWWLVADQLWGLGQVLLFVLLLRWPRSRLQTRAQLWLVRIMLVTVPLLNLILTLVYDPAWEGYPDLWWPTVVSSKSLYFAVVYVGEGVVLALLAAFWVVLAARVRWASRPERRELVPVVIAALALSASHTYNAALGFLPESFFQGGYESALMLVWELLFYVAYLMVPLSFLVAMLVRRIQRAFAVESLLRPEELPTPESVRQALAKAMGDDRLGLALYSAELGGYVDVDGAPADEVPADRFGVEVAAADGTPKARIDLHPRLEGRPELTTSVVQAAAVALDNARLRAELRAQLREVDESRLRLEAARVEGERLSRLLPGGLAEKLRLDPSAVDRTESLTVTVLMSDVRGYSGIAERAEPSRLAGQLKEHRRAMNAALLAEGGTVMQYVGDAVMAVFGAPFPQPDHARRALAAAAQMHQGQAEVNQGWVAAGLEPFGLGIGVSTGPVAAGLLGSEERVEYTVVGDTVNLAHRLQDAARPAGSTVASAATVQGCDATEWMFEQRPPLMVKGRVTPVSVFTVRPASAHATVG